MVFIKSFFRKRTTKILILILSFVLIGLLYLHKNISDYNILLNESFSNSFIYADSSYNVENNKNIKNINETIYTGIYYLIENDQLSNNSCVIPNFLKDITFNEFVIIIENKEFSLEIVDYYDSKISPIIYISKDVFESLKKEYNYGYIIKITNWIDSEKIIKKLSYQNKGKIYGYEINESNINYQSLIKTNNFFFKVITVMLIILVFYILYYIWHIYSNNKELYKSLGIKNKNIILIFAINLISFLTISFSLSYIIFNMCIRLL